MMNKVVNEMWDGDTGNFNLRIHIDSASPEQMSRINTASYIFGRELNEIAKLGEVENL